MSVCVCCVCVYMHAEYAITFRHLTFSENFGTDLYKSQFDLINFQAKIIFLMLQ